MSPHFMYIGGPAVIPGGPPVLIDYPTAFSSIPTGDSGSVFSVLNGVWANAPTSFTYKWVYKDLSDNDLPNPQHVNSFVADPATTGLPFGLFVYNLACVVTAHNAFGSTSARSNMLLLNFHSTRYVVTVPCKMKAPLYVEGGTVSLVDNGYVYGRGVPNLSEFFYPSSTQLPGPSISINAWMMSGGGGQLYMIGREVGAPRVISTISNDFRLPFDPVFDINPPHDYLYGGSPAVLTFPSITASSLNVGDTILVSSVGAYQHHDTIEFLGDPAWKVNGVGRGEASSYTIQPSDRGCQIYCTMEVRLVVGGLLNVVPSNYLSIPL